MKGGKSFQDRMRTVNVRNIALDHIEKILSPRYKDKKYQKELLLRMAPNLLPRLNEHSGTDGEDLNVIFMIPGQISKKHGITTKKV